jgi:hypothetical protein
LGFETARRHRSPEEIAIGAAVPLSYRAPDNPGRGARVLFSLTSALKLCPARPTTRCLQLSL